MKGSRLAFWEEEDDEEEEASESSRRRQRGVVWRPCLGHAKEGAFLRAGILEVYRRALKPRPFVGTAM